MFAMGGAFVAILVACIRLCLSVKDLPIAFLRHLYNQRSKIIKRERFYIVKNKVIGSAEKGIVDFCSTLLLFLTYILTSFVCFDGIFRLIYLLPLLLIYLITNKLLSVLFHQLIYKIVEFIFRSLSCILTLPIFLIWCFLHVLKIPILYIIVNVNHVVQYLLSKRRMRKLKCTIKDECNHILNILNN